MFFCDFFLNCCHLKSNRLSLGESKLWWFHVFGLTSKTDKKKNILWFFIKMNHTIYLSPSVYLCGRMYRLELRGNMRADIQMRVHAQIQQHALMQSHAYKWPHVLIQRVRCTDTERERESVKCSITGGVNSLSPFPCLGAGAASCAACVGVPPTHPSVPIGARGPRVHLASSSVSVELSPMTATTDSLNVPVILFRGVAERKKFWTQWPQLKGLYY